MHSRQPTGFDAEGHRASAYAEFGEGFRTIGRAFGIEDTRTACSDRPYCFDQITRNRVISRLLELHYLMRDGRVEPNPSHADWLRAQAARDAARQDPALQALITRASKKTPIRAKRA